MEPPAHQPATVNGLKFNDSAGMETNGNDTRQDEINRHRNEQLKDVTNLPKGTLPPKTNRQDVVGHQLELTENLADATNCNAVNENVRNGDEVGHRRASRPLSDPSPTSVSGLSDISPTSVVTGAMSDTSLTSPTLPSSDEESARTTRHLAVTVQKKDTLVVGLRNEVMLHVFYADDPRRVLRTKMLSVVGTCEEEVENLICQLKSSRKGTRLIFWPKTVGKCVFHMRSPGCRSFRFELEVEGNNPLMSFGEDNYWPVALAVRQDDNTMYIAFMHHVSKYTCEGDFQREVLRERQIHFNDIAVDQVRHYMAVSVSGWRKDGTHKFRFQAVRVYSLSGTPLWAVGRQHPLFGVSIIRIAFDPRGNLLVASRGALCTCARATGVVERRAEAEFGTAARMAITSDGHVVVADGNRGHIYVFDSTITPKTNFRVRIGSQDVSQGRDAGIDEAATSGVVIGAAGSIDGSLVGGGAATGDGSGGGAVGEASIDGPVVGLTGLSVDRFRHILVSECLTNSIQVYTLEGTLLAVIDSEWDFCKWPLALAVSGDGHVFVADHGHACVKKYRYM